MKENLRTELHSVNETKSTSICMTFRPLGWVRFLIDDQLGGLTIDSDWGNWTHVWGGGPENWGYPTFTDFLKTRPDYNYLVDKLHYGGRTRDLIDGDATRKAMNARIIRARRAAHRTEQDSFEPIDKARARELWEGVEQFVYQIEDKPTGDHIWNSLRSIEEECYCSQFSEFFYDIHELIFYKPHPRLVFLRDELLPLLIAHLRGELHVERASVPKTKPVDAGEARVAKRVPRRRKKVDKAVPRRRRR